MSSLRKHGLRAAGAVYRTTLAAPVARLFQNELIAKTSNFGDVRWLGYPVWQSVLDLWTIQEVISELRPALVIETGTNRGGSALFYANLMDLAGSGEVVTVDVERLHDLKHPRIEFLIGSSLDPDVLERVRARADAVDGPVMVILDSDHAASHVAAELDVYADFVTSGSYLLVQDGVIDVQPIFSEGRPGPLPAIHAFRTRRPDFEPVPSLNERFVITHHPDGWFRRR